jgi:hypothetical protein
MDVNYEHGMYGLIVHDLLPKLQTSHFCQRVCRRLAIKSTDWYAVCLFFVGGEGIRCGSFRTYQIRLRIGAGHRARVTLSPAISVSICRSSAKNVKPTSVEASLDPVGL